MINGIEDFWSALEIGAQEVIEADKEWIESDVETRLIRAQLPAEYRQHFKCKQFDSHNPTRVNRTLT